MIYVLVGTDFLSTYLHEIEDEEFCLLQIGKASFWKEIRFISANLFHVFKSYKHYNEIFVRISI